MHYSYITPEAIDAFIQQALAEDVGDGDHTSLASISAGTQGKAQLILKDSGILAGMEIAQHIFKKVDPALQLNILMKDGDTFHPGQIALTVSGSVHSILTAERLVLNSMQRMSGIASYTHHLQSLIAHTKAKVLDTRKTTPNFRMLEKWAVKIGGGVNHRYGLFDMILLKDNHNDFSGGIKQALQNSKAYVLKTGKDLKIEIETRNLKEVKEALTEGGAFRIMLDNMSPELMKEAVQLINHTVETEASGGINENTIVAVAESGVDYISIGSLSHSYKSKDMSLKAF